MTWKNKFNQLIQGFGSKGDEIPELVPNACLVPNYMLQIACTTHTGKVRGHNEDNFSLNQIYLPTEHQSMEKAMFIEKRALDFPTVAVFDGMGGEYGGEIASYVSAKIFTESEHVGAWMRADIDDLICRMNESVCEATQEVKANQMGSTFVGLFFNEETVYFANLGDSPAYLYRDQYLEKISLAHTNERFLQMQGITNRKPGLTQFLGVCEDGLVIEPHIVMKNMSENDVYLLCSDGLTDMVSEERICEIVKDNEDILNCVTRLQDEALDNGGRDNITIMLCKVMKE